MVLHRKKSTGIERCNVVEKIHVESCRKSSHDNSHELILFLGLEKIFKLLNNAYNFRITKCSQYVYSQQCQNV